MARKIPAGHSPARLFSGASRVRAVYPSAQTEGHHEPMSPALAPLRQSKFTATSSARLLSSPVRRLRHFFPSPIAEFPAGVITYARALSVQPMGPRVRGGVSRRRFYKGAPPPPSAIAPLLPWRRFLCGSRSDYGASGVPALAPPSLRPGRFGRGLRLQTPAEGCAPPAPDGCQVSEGGAIRAPPGEPPKPGAVYRRALPGAPGPSAAASRGRPSRAGLAEDGSAPGPLVAARRAAG